MTHFGVICRLGGNRSKNAVGATHKIIATKQGTLRCVPFLVVNIEVYFCNAQFFCNRVRFFVTHGGANLIFCALPRSDG